MHRSEQHLFPRAWKGVARQMHTNCKKPIRTIWCGSNESAELRAMSTITVIASTIMRFSRGLWPMLIGLILYDLVYKTT